MYGTMNQNVWVLQIKCMVTTNQNVWSIQIKCMVITSQMYSHYTSGYIQFLTLGGLHDRLYKPSKFPFLVGHITCLSKHLIPPANFVFSRSHGLIMSSIKFPFLVIFGKCLLKMLSQLSKFPFLESHMT